MKAIENLFAGITALLIFCIGVILFTATFQALMIPGFILIIGSVLLAYHTYFIEPV